MSVVARGVLRFIGGGVVKLGADIEHVVVHCEAAGLIITVQLEIDSSIEVAFFIDCYFIVLFEGVDKMIGMALAYIFDTEVINF